MINERSPQKQPPMIAGKVVFSVPVYQRIRDLREDRDLTQKQMGEILSCGQRVYGSYERAETDIPTAILVELANFYNVSIDYLLNRTDNPKLNK